MKLTKESAIERAFNICNLELENDEDIIYKSIYKFKVLRDLKNEEIEKIYNYISDRLGLTS